MPKRKNKKVNKARLKAVKWIGATGASENMMRNIDAHTDYVHDSIIKGEVAATMAMMHDTGHPKAITEAEQIPVMEMITGQPTYQTQRIGEMHTRLFSSIRERDETKTRVQAWKNESGGYAQGELR